MFTAAPALAAALSLVATPVSGAALPTAGSDAALAAAPAWQSGDEAASYHRRYRNYRHNRVDAGDILTGVLIIGGIAAVAGAVKDAELENYRDRDWRYPTDGEPFRDDDASGLDRAVSICVDEIERNSRVESVDAANRSAGGWRVTGSLYNGEGFTCSIGADGRIEAIDYGAGTSPYRLGTYEDAGAGNDRQWDDERYAAERDRVEGGNAQPEAEAPYPDEPSEDYEPADGNFETGGEYEGAD